MATTDVGASTTETSSEITVRIRDGAKNHDIKLANNQCLVKELKEELAAIIDKPYDRLMLIHLGKVLKNDAILESHDIKDGSVVHLVVRSAPDPKGDGTFAPVPTNSSQGQSTASPASRPMQSTLASDGAPNLQQNSFANMMGGSGGINPFAAMGGNMNFEAMQRQMMRNPEMMQQMMNSPIAQGLLSNPQLLSSMIENNPQIQQIVERNPELGAVMRDPNTIQQAMEMMRNPAMFNEMMRSHDRAIGNLQGMPGGQAALQQLYTDIQEPLYDSFSGNNPFATLSNNGTTQQTNTAGQENTGPAPDPWAAPTAQNNASRQSQPAANAGSFGGVGVPAGNDFMTQMFNDPNVMNSLMGMMGGGGAAQQPINQAGASTAGVPALIQSMLTDSRFTTQTQNASVREALNTMHQATENLQTTAPDIMSAIFNSTPAQRRGPIAQNNNQNMANMMQMMMQMMAADPTANLSGDIQSNEAPEQRFASQLEQLTTMGFVNREENIRALLACNGNLNLAIERLLSGI